jgi:hypothetical protein
VHHFCGVYIYHFPNLSFTPSDQAQLLSHEGPHHVTFHVKTAITQAKSRTEGNFTFKASCLHGVKENAHATTDLIFSGHSSGPAMAPRMPALLAETPHELTHNAREAVSHVGDG